MELKVGNIVKLNFTFSDWMTGDWTKGKIIYSKTN